VPPPALLDEETLAFPPVPLLDEETLVLAPVPLLDEEALAFPPVPLLEEETLEATLALPPLPLLDEATLPARPTPASVPVHPPATESSISSATLDLCMSGGTTEGTWRVQSPLGGQVVSFNAPRATRSRRTGQIIS
jgi:hypothetical protein